MIRLVTGLPGHGKSLFVMSLIDKEAKATKRQIYLAGISQFKKTKIDNYQKRLHLITYEEIKDWKSFVTGSLVVIDEAQEIFPQRQKGNAPDYITDLSTHRHHGLDFIIITQDPRLLDAWSRRLINEHINIKRLWGTNIQIHMKWDRCVDTPRDPKEFRNATRKFSIINKDYFGWYKSADEHNVKKEVPAKLLIGLVVVGAFPLVLYFGAKYASSIVSEDHDTPPSVAEDSTTGKTQVQKKTESNSSGSDIFDIQYCRIVGEIYKDKIFEINFTDGKRWVGTGNERAVNKFDCSNKPLLVGQFSDTLEETQGSTGQQASNSESSFNPFN